MGLQNSDVNEQLTHIHTLIHTHILSALLTRIQSSLSFHHFPHAFNCVCVCMCVCEHVYTRTWDWLNRLQGPVQNENM